MPGGRSPSMCWKLPCTLAGLRAGLGAGLRAGLFLYPVSWAEFLSADLSRPPLPQLLKRLIPAIALLCSSESETSYDVQLVIEVDRIIVVGRGWFNSIVSVWGPQIGFIHMLIKCKYN